MATLDNIIESMDSKNQQLSTTFNDRLDDIFRNVIQLTQTRIVERGITTANALDFDLEFNRILNDTGYYDLVNEYIDDAYDKNYSDILDAFSEVGLETVFKADQLRDIQALKELDLDFFNSLGIETGRTVKANLYKYTLGGASANDIAALIARDLEGSNLDRYAKTYAQTAIQNYNQAVIDMLAVDLEGVWLYTGVKDKKTRDFCQCVLNQNAYFNDSDKSKIQSDKRRQYNCRHIFLKTSVEYAIADGLKKGTAKC